MVLPLLFGLAGSALGGAGLAGGLGALTAGAIGSGLGRFAETGDLGKGIETGLTSFLGGKALGAVGKGLNIEALDPSKIPTGIPEGGNALKTGLETLKNPAVLGQAALGQATVPPPALPPVAPVDFENRQAGVPDRITKRPPKGYRPGYDGEFDYGVSPNYGVGLMSQNDPRYMGSKTKDAGITQLQRVAMENPELMYSGMSPMFMNVGGLVGLLGNKQFTDFMGEMGRSGKGFGLLGALDTPQARAEYNQMMTGEYSPEPQQMSNGGELKPIPEDNKGLPNLPKDVRNKMGFMQEGGAVESDMEANKVIDDAVNAIKGLSDSPEIALGVFVAKYGEEALEDLIERVDEGEFDQLREDNMIEGEGDGMDDKVPATLEGEQDVMLSDGEFVVPADVVSGIGNGSSDAGAKELEEMMTRVRQLRTGKTEQPEQVPQEMMLPV